MLCEKCKIREANIKYTEIVNGVKTEHNLCSHCAKEMDFGQYTALLDGEFPLGKLLSGLLGLETDTEETDARARVVCPTCGTSFDDFVENSRFGCPDCYGVFDLFIKDKIKQLQGSEEHKGRHPKYMRSQKKEIQVSEGTVQNTENSGETRVYHLEAELKAALKREDYQEAARLRDEIRGLKAAVDEGGAADE